MLTNAPTAEAIDTLHQAIEELTVVTDHDNSAVEGCDGLFQHILGFHIKVVGRLIEDEEVDGLQQELDHCQTRAFAARQHFHLLVRSLAAEHEGSEDIADAHTDIATRYTVNGVEDREFRVKELRLVLSEVTNLCIMSHFQMSLEGYLAENTFHERGFALAVAPHKGHLLTTTNGEVHLGDDFLLSIRFPQVFHNQRKIARALAGRELQV